MAAPGATSAMCRPLDSSGISRARADLVEGLVELATPVLGDNEGRTLPSVRDGGTGAPSGTVTFLFTDIEQSTALVERLGDDYGPLLEAHNRIVFDAVHRHGGHTMGTEGDGSFSAFARPSAAVAAAIDVQRNIVLLHSSQGVGVRVRVGIHTGEAVATSAGYVGLALHTVARICDAAHGGQVLVSDATRHLVEGVLPAETSLKNLGEHRFKDLGRPERLFQLVHPSLDTSFPPLNTLEAVANNLPTQLTTFVGREREIGQVTYLLGAARLVTVIGPGGSGKTRLALQVAANVLQDFDDGAWLVDLAATTDGSVIPETVASILGVRGASRVATGLAPDSAADREDRRALLDAVVDRLRSSRALLVIDNCEHLVGECALLATTLLEHCPGVVVLATSREPLRVPGEARWRIPPLGTPPARSEPDSAAEYEAVRLFVDRARLNQTDFVLDDTTAPAVVEICRRLEGMPLALELAAAWISALNPGQILARLDDQFRLLATGQQRGSARQRTLRATVDWSYELLTEPERVLLENLSIFGGGFSLEAAERVCTGTGLESGDVVHLLAQLVDKSLVLKETSGEGRYRLLEVIRQYGWEKVADNTPPTSTGAAAEDAPASAALVREGDYWSVTGPSCETFRLRNSKGLTYLHRLIDQAGRELHVFDLVGGGEPDDEGVRRQLGDAGPQLDSRAKAAYRRRLQDLQSEAEEAGARNDLGHLEKVQAEIEFLTNELTNAFGIGGSSRKTASAAERARLSVTKAIKAAIDRIEDHNPALAGHLATTVRTGGYCSYQPDPLHPLRWKLR